MCSFKKKFLLCPCLEMSLHFKLHMETFSCFARWFYFLINFLISKQNKTPTIDPKMVKQQAGIATFRHTLSFTQTNRGLELNINTVNRYINTSTSINCIYSLACFCFHTNILNKFSCLVCTWFQYLLYKFKRHSKLYQNSHPIKNLFTFA